MHSIFNRGGEHRKSNPFHVHTHPSANQPANLPIHLLSCSKNIVTTANSSSSSSCNNNDPDSNSNSNSNSSSSNHHPPAQTTASPLHLLLKPVSTRSALQHASSTSVASSIVASLDHAVDCYNSAPPDADTSRVESFLLNVLCVLRVLCQSSEKAVRKGLLKLKVPVAICRILQNLPDARNTIAMEASVACLPEHALYAARALGRLSLQEPMRNLINSDPHHLRDLLRLLTYWGDQVVMNQYKASSSSSGGGGSGDGAGRGKQGTYLNIVLRVAFALGNLTASNDENRKLMILRFGGGKAIPACLSGVAAIYMKEAMEPTENNAVLVDALVKLTRLIANVCINKVSK